MDTPHSEDTGQILLIDKPYDWTSFDVVKKIRNALKIKKIGHAGTLDPLATGLLILCTGPKTKEINHFQDLDKEYDGSLVLGQKTASIDLETPILEKLDISHLNEDQIRRSAEKFVGKMDQLPPDYSALKVGGRRMYHQARQGIKIELKTRPVEIMQFNVTSVNLPEVHFNVVCSKGTYIRSLVRDLGADLGVGAVLISLRRTRIGDFTLDQAQDLSDFLTEIGSGPLAKDRPHRFLRSNPQS